MSAPAIQAKWEGLEGIGPGILTNLTGSLCKKTNAVLELCLVSLNATEDALKEQASGINS